MKRALLITVGAALVLAAPAAAKGPDEATITGPGLDSPIVLGGDAEGNFNSRFGRFVEGTGFFPAVFRQAPDPMLDKRPAGELGPRYTIVYRVPGGEPAAMVEQDLYPYAEGGPVTYMRPGQPVFGGAEHTRGGWFVSRNSDLAATLQALGLLKTTPNVARPEPERRRSVRWLPLAFAGLLLPAAAFAIRRRTH